MRPAPLGGDERGADALSTLAPFDVQHDQARQAAFQADVAHSNTLRIDLSDKERLVRIKCAQMHEVLPVSVRRSQDLVELDIHHQWELQGQLDVKTAHGPPVFFSTASNHS